MNEDPTTSDLGEINLIDIIEKLVLEKTGKPLLKDDSFYLSFQNDMRINDSVVLNTDMLVSTTDMPKQMKPYYVGQKAMIMNVSDLIVKGVGPVAVILSLGLPSNYTISDFKSMIKGILDYCLERKIEYLGGDLNQTEELIINPTVIGFSPKKHLIHRNEIDPGDLIVANGRFGLTGVGLDILVKRKRNLSDFPNYKRSVMSVLEPSDVSDEGIILANLGLAKASIDSSDGLLKSLTDLMRSNPGIGFEIEYSLDLVDEEAIHYSEEHGVPVEELIFSAGEEFIHLFVIRESDYDEVQKNVRSNGGRLVQIGSVIDQEKVFFRKDKELIEVNLKGYEHFS